MSFVNKVTLLGFVGQEPTIRYTTTGKAIASFSLATNRQYTDSEGERQKDVEWHQLVAFDRRGEVAGQLLEKGSQIYVEGRLRPGTWTDKEGRKRRSHEIWVNNFQLLSKSKGVQSSVQAEAPSDEAEVEIPF